MQYYLLTLGCPKNTVDSEGMAMLLAAEGHRGTAKPEEADLLIVNTCGFLAASEDEAIAALRELAGGKREGQRLVAAGCMAERNGNRILREVPEVDGLLGTRRWMEIAPLTNALHGRVGPGVRPDSLLLGDPRSPWLSAMPRSPVMHGSAYLKISDGCDASCAFCSIPTFKGKMQSRPPAAIVAEARALVAQGAKEIILIGQDTTAYGRDLRQSDGLAALIRNLLDQVAGIRWLRLMYAYPTNISKALIEVMAGDPRVCHYLDIPLQHGDPGVLSRMRRPSNLETLHRTIAEVRGAMPDMAFRSTFIVGFPGETEAEFTALLDFAREIRFDKVGVFTFSAEPGTGAATMPDQVAAEVKKERFDRLMQAQQRISLERNQAQIGRALEVLVEGTGQLGGRKGQVSYARSYRDAPEVDGLVLIPGSLTAGEMTNVRVTGALEYDLLAEQKRAEVSPRRDNRRR